MSATDLRTLPPIPKKARVAPPEKISQTLLSKWDTCHRSAYLYLKHKGGPQSHAMARGEAFHQFVEEAVAYLRDEGETEMPAEVGKDRMMELIARRRDLVLPEHEQNALRALAWNWCAATVVDPDRLVGIEQMIELEVGGWIVRGKLDFAEVLTDFNRAVVRDYKTALAVPSQDEIENGAKSFQGRLYACLLLFGLPEGETFPLGVGIDEVDVELCYPRYVNSATGEMVGRTVTWTRDQLVDFRASAEIHVEGLARSLDDGLWQASPGSHCFECPCRPECPIPEQHHDFEEIADMDQAVALAEQWYVRDLANRRLKDSLRGFAEQLDEPIYFGDYKLAFRLQERREIDWEAIDRGVPLDRAVSVVPSTKFDKFKISPEER